MFDSKLCFKILRLHVYALLLPSQHPDQEGVEEKQRTIPAINFYQLTQGVDILYCRGINFIIYFNEENMHIKVTMNSGSSLSVFDVKDLKRALQ